MKPASKVRPFLAAANEDGSRIFCVTGVAGSQRFITEESMANFDPQELAILIEADSAHYVIGMGWDIELTPIEVAAVALDSRVRADQARKDAQAARARRAAAAPRKSRQHHARGRALKIAAKIMANRASTSPLSRARLAELTADQLATHGIDPPAPRSISRWLKKAGL